MSELIQRHVLVTGRVQGVYFRQSTAVEARKHPGLKGFVRNLPDGRVEAVFVGESKAVLALVAWCQQGPPAAEVTRLEVLEETPEPSWAREAGFSIRY